MLHWYLTTFNGSGHLWSRCDVHLYCCHGDGLTCQDDSLATPPHAHDASPRGRLLPDQFDSVESLPPVFRQHAVSRSGDRVFWDASIRGKDSTYAVDPGPITSGRYRDEASTGRSNALQVGDKITHQPCISEHS